MRREGGRAACCSRQHRGDMRCGDLQWRELEESKAGLERGGQG